MVDLGEAINKGFSSWWNIIGVVCILAVIYGIVAAAFSGLFYFVLPDAVAGFAEVGPDSTAIDLFKNMYTPKFIATFASSLIIQSIVSVFIFAFIVTYLRTKNLAEAQIAGFEKLLPLIGTGILVFLLVMLGGILFIIPGIILTGYLVLSSYSVIIRKKRPVDAMKYSYKLVHTNWWRTVGTFFVVGILSGVVSLVLNIVIGIPVGFLTTLAPGLTSNMVSAFVNAFIMIIQVSLGYAMILVYFLGLEKEQNLESD